MICISLYCHLNLIYTFLILISMAVSSAHLVDNFYCAFLSHFEAFWTFYMEKSEHWVLQSSKQELKSPTDLEQHECE